MSAVDGGAAPGVFSDLARNWRPEPETAEEALGPWPAGALAALLGADPPGPGGALPPLWHEVYLRDSPRIDELGEDGHPRGGALLPPIPRRRRMFGGARLTVHAPLRIGDTVRRTSAVQSVRTRHGRSGWLLLVTERHEFAVDGRLRLVDERDIVYRMPDDVRGPAPAASPARAADDGTTGHGNVPVLRLEPDERLLMLTSALTYNPHRIHYDRDYATRVEGHPGLVVHGPLLALAGIEAARRLRGLYPDRVDFRLTATAYPGAPIDFVETAVQADAGGHGAGGHGADGPARTAPGSVRVVGHQAGRRCIRVDAAWSAPVSRRA